MLTPSFVTRISNAIFHQVSTMSVPQTGLPILCYLHPAVLHGMASTYTPSRSLSTTKPTKKDLMLEDIKMRVKEVRRRIEFMNREDEEIEQLVVKVRDKIDRVEFV